MADETTQATEDTGQTAAAVQSGERTFTQDEVNRMVTERIQRERRKYEGYVDGKEAADAAKRAEEAEAELARLKAEAERSANVSTAAEKAGIPIEVVQMLNGADADELTAQAERLLKLLPAHPTRTDDGGKQAVAKKSTADKFAEALFGI